MKMIDIGRVAELTGLTTATIRYYESKGLITPAGRRGLTRIYDEEVLTRLSLIILAKQGHFSLDEIAVMLSELPVRYFDYDDRLHPRHAGTEQNLYR